MKNIKNKLIYAIYGIFLFVSGCRVVTLDLPPNKKITYVNFFFDTRIGVLDITTPQGEHLHIENEDSSSQALVVAGKALDAVNAVSHKVP